MKEHQLRTSKDNQVKVVAESAEAVAHFADPENHVGTILRQINEERMYDPIFADKEDMTVLDLGANVGLFSLYAADSCERVVAVEAVPSTYAIATELTAKHPQIELHQYAISDKDQDVSFYINENSTTNSLVSHSGKEITVPGITIASLLEKLNIDHVDFVKCDIEGSEVIALTEETVGAVADKIDFWFVEVHQTNNGEVPWPGNLEMNRQQLKTVFENCGYTVEPVIHDQLYAFKA
jgi:FkbM family methyltransferase